LNRAVSEVWKPIKGYERLYSVSNFGEVKSHDRKVWNGNGFYTKKGRILKKSLTTTGYWKVELYKDTKRRSMRVHRLVAKEFLPRVKGKNLINHKDGNPLNNHVKNLEWCTQSENIRHAYETGLIRSNFTRYKDAIANEYVRDKSSNIGKLARKYGCSDSSIRRYLQKKGIKTRSISESQDVYGIDREKMIMYFEEGLSNKEIAEKFNANNGLIGTYRYQYRRGKLKI